MKVLCFGSINIDVVFRVPHMVKLGETLTARSMNKDPGGKGANQACALARSGVDVYFAGRIGEDGRFVMKALQESNVNTDLIKVTDGSTGQAIIEVDDNGDNSIVLYAGENREINHADVDEVIGKFSAGDWLILQNEVSDISYMIEKAHEQKMIICLNPAPFTEDIMDLPLDKINILILNEVEGAGMAGLNEGASWGDIMKAIRKKLNIENVVLTLGKDGAVWFNQTDYIFQPIFDSPVVDTTAAGDTFIGYFVASLIKGYSIKNALEKASFASSITVSRNGAMASIPLASEIFD